MSRLLRVILGLALVALVGAAYAWLIGWHFGFDAEKLFILRQITGFASAAAVLLLIIGELFGIERHGYYMICCGGAFLAADLMLMLVLDIHPAVRPSQEGFFPLSLAGVFLGPVYRVVASSTPHLPRDPLA